MACEPITPDLFRQMKPSFSDVDDGTLALYIDLAQAWTGGDWPERLCSHVPIAVVCHLMTLDGLGTGAEAQGFLTGESEMQTVRSGSVTLTRFRSTAQRAGYSTSEWFSQTSCGRMFLALLRTIMGGPIVVGPGCPSPQTAYAKDAWWSRC